jgi:hypothetical protein
MILRITSGRCVFVSGPSVLEFQHITRKATIARLITSKLTRTQVTRCVIS